MDICAMQWHQAKIRILCNIRFFLTPKGRLLIHYVSEYMKSIPTLLQHSMWYLACYPTRKWVVVVGSRGDDVGLYPFVYICKWRHLVSWQNLSKYREIIGEEKHKNFDHLMQFVRQKLRSTRQNFDLLMQFERQKLRSTNEKNFDLPDKTSIY